MSVSTKPQAAGNGRFVETSSKQVLTAIGSVDVGAIKGNAGTWLLDPVSSGIEIKNTYYGILADMRRKYTPKTYLWDLYRFIREAALALNISELGTVVEKN